MAFLVRRRGEEHPLSSFRREMDRLFEDFFGGFPLLRGAEALLTHPAVDVAEDDKQLEVHVELPGVDPKEVSVTAEDNVLTIKGEKKVERESKEHRWHIVERSYGSFTRSIALPASVDAQKTKAAYKDGVLTIVLPKRPEEQARKIEIKVE